MSSESETSKLSSELVKSSLGKELNKLVNENKPLNLHFSSREDYVLEHISLMLPNITVQEIQEKLASGSLDHKFQYLQSKHSQEIKEISIRDFIEKLKNASLFDDSIEISDLDEFSFNTNKDELCFTIDTKDLAYSYIKRDLLKSLNLKLTQCNESQQEFLTFHTLVSESKKSLIINKQELQKIIENISTDNLKHKIITYYEQDPYFISLESLIKQVWTCKLLRKSLGLSSSDCSSFVNNFHS